MAKQGNKKSGIMKNLLVVFLLVLSFGASSQEFGYILTINDNNKLTAPTQSFKSPSIDEVQKCILEKTGISFDLNKLLSVSPEPYFQGRYNGFDIYCEKKELVKRMDGSFAYKRIKQKGQKSDGLMTKDEQMAQSFVNFGEQPEETASTQEITTTLK